MKCPEASECEHRPADPEAGAQRTTPAHTLVWTPDLLTCEGENTVLFQTPKSVVICYSSHTKRTPSETHTSEREMERA